MSIQQISIPKPCLEQWQLMTAVNGGRHCDQCCKTVTDFTLMTNKEIVDHLKRNNNTCGRFNPYQLEQLNNSFESPYHNTFGIKRLVLATSIISALPFFKSEAKQLNKIEQVEPVYNKNKPAIIADTVKLVTIKGKIIAADDKQPLPSAALKLKGTSRSTTTNGDGNFELKDVPVSGIITASFIGFQTRDFKVDNFVDGSVLIQLKIYPEITGDIVIVQRPSLPKRMWHKIKNLF